MSVTWDPRKAKANRGKHGVRFSDAETVLFDRAAVTREDLSARGEQRFVTVGTDAMGRVLVVVYSYREDDVQLISAPSATRKERLEYEEGI
jgi:uncharacterized DUF497 family protein